MLVSNKVFSGTLTASLISQAFGCHFFTVSNLSYNTLSSLISLAIFFYSRASILLESHVTLGILIFSFLFSKIHGKIH